MLSNYNTLLLHTGSLYMVYTFIHLSASVVPFIFKVISLKMIA